MDIDLTFFIQLGVFITLLVTLNVLLFKPFLRVLEARHEKLHGQRLEVDRLLREAATDLDVYQGRMREARDQAQKEREVLVTAGRDEERRLIAEVRADINKAVQEARQEVQAAETAAKKSLDVETQALAKGLVHKLLGREVG